MTPPPSHICPKCRQAYDAANFFNAAGRPTRWCMRCREIYRSRLTSLHQKREVIAKGLALNAPETVAKSEGYGSHPLANLLALSHIAGAKRALAIRDGSSWRGKKAWREYYQAKRALEAALADKSLLVLERLSDEVAFITTPHPLLEKRDPNSEGVS